MREDISRQPGEVRYSNTVATLVQCNHSLLSGFVLMSLMLIIFGRPWFSLLTVAGIVGYFALATYFNRTFVDPRPSGKVVLLLTGPFTHESGFAYWVSRLREEDRRILANIVSDDPKNAKDTSSPIQLYEGSSPLGPGHSTFRAISKTGRGHFAYWSERGIFFSSSDNTNPNENRRRYWAVVP